MTSPTTRLENLWVARTPLTDPPPSSGEHRRTPFDNIGRAIAWPLAVVLVLHRVFVLALNGSVTDDFTTVYSAVRRAIEGVPVYNEIYHHVDPHYLYNPGATLLLTPLGWLTDVDAARTAFIIANAAAVIGALALLTRMFGYSLRSFVWPTAITVAFLTESVRNTLIFSNINGILLLALVGFLSLLLSGRGWSAGLLIGLAILIKPQFAPLLFLPAVKLDWRTVFGGIIVPVGFNLAAWPLVPGASDYLGRLVPYLGEVRDYANSSLSGAAVYFGMPPVLETAIWLLFAAIVAVGVLVLLRWRYTDPLLWATTTSGLLLAGVFFLSSLGQMYYSMMLFPMMFTVLQRTSVFHTWPAWLAAYLFLTPDSFNSARQVDLSRWLDFFHPTIGWAMMLTVVTSCALVWWREESLDSQHDRFQTDQRHRVAEASDA
ncbi:glycosyltransferase family 87 protein [Corynebacterium comes]|uniref:Alpha-(1->3)-arabinofuranosyltransferase n=1 Tax=Corynebacterium comes TaxID=2675218 RepID=A0A6B8W1F3_9CORY|nr:glycosyltransferase family 87 protein [Corynebacterium comes]QGU04766.1 Alpha-(1->3)-arabinofuranosyltransferase [Corynebacterium comes]